MIEEIIVKDQAYEGLVIKDNKENYLSYSYIKDKWLIDENGKKGKLQYTGTEHIYEQGFSGSFDKYAFITIEAEVFRISCLNKDMKFKIEE